MSRLLKVLLLLGFAFLILLYGFGKQGAGQVIAANTLELHRGGNFTGLFLYDEFKGERLNELKTMRGLGLDFIRLPIDPVRLYDSNNPNWKNLAQTITTANRLDLRVIVDLHPSTPDKKQILNGDPRFLKLLSDMAKFLKSFERNMVLLEPMNEPIAPSGDACTKTFDWGTVQKNFVQIVRQVSADIPLVLTGACWGGVDGLQTLAAVSDKNVLYSIHSYSPFLFTHQGALWSDVALWYLHQLPYPASSSNKDSLVSKMLYNMPSTNIKNEYRSSLQEYFKSGWNKNKLLQELNKAVFWAKRNKAQLLLGEFGALSDDAPPQDRVQWLRDMREAAESFGIPHAVWDFSSTGNFGPYRNGKLEAGALAALGLKIPSYAIPTPKNSGLLDSIPNNAFVVQQKTIADFEKGNQNILGEATRYSAFGNPKEASYSSTDTANKLEFEYSIPAEDSYGGVVVVVPTKGMNAAEFTHLRFEAAVKGSGTLRVALASEQVNTNGDNPQMLIPVNENTTTYTIPFTVFKQYGWGTTVPISEMVQKLERIEISVIDVGTAGKASFDSFSFVQFADASDGKVFNSNNLKTLYDFELPNKAGNFGGTWQKFSYEQNPKFKSVISVLPTDGKTGKMLEMRFILPGTNTWAGALTTLPFGQKRNLLNSNAIRLDLSAKGVGQLRVEIPSSLDTGGDNPQIYLNVNTEMKTYRIPISEFAQAGWGKQLPLTEILQNADSVAVFADTVGTQGIVRIDNLLLENK